ncbi:MAG TPA: isochorismate synthase [Balneolaceae bacterium]|nr:isochorismate synthase [Balneolaceae bacterium]
MQNSFSNTLESIDFTLINRLETFAAELLDPSSHQKYGTVSLPIEAIDPLFYLEKHRNDEGFQYYWEKPSEEFAIAAGEEMLNISASGKGRFQAINQQVKAIQETTSEYSHSGHPCSGLMFLGGFSFFDTISDEVWKSFKPASFTIPKWMIIRDGRHHLLTLFFDVQSFSSPQSLHRYLLHKIEEVNHFIADTPVDKANGSQKMPHQNHLSGDQNVEYERWISSVKKAKEQINQNNFKKIVLARHISQTARQTSPVQIINRLRGEYPDCYNFLIHHPEGRTFLGSTPEKLASFRHQTMQTEALAGSIQRGETSAEDALFEQNLTASSKEQHEHNFVVKDINQRLKPFVEHFDTNQQPEIRKLANVQHLYTPIRASLKSDVDILSIVEQLHPTPAVGGYPREKAVPYIQQFEDFERGWYAGPIGWLNTQGRGAFGVAIRSGLLTKSDAHFYAGCGIVADSDPYTEWQETNLKFQPMLSAL